MSAPQRVVTNNRLGERPPIPSHLCLARNASVAGDHVLCNALQAEDRICNERHAPESAVMFAQVVRGKHRSRALRNGDAIGTGYSRMRTVQVGRLHFHVAHVGFSGKPVLTGEERRVRVSKSAGGRDYREADKARADNFLLRRFGSGCGNRSLHHEVASRCRPAGRIRQFAGNGHSAEC